MTDEQFIPEEDDYFVDAAREDEDEAVARIVEKMNREQFWPNVWSVNDHGNITLLSVNADTGEWHYTDTAYV